MAEGSDFELGTLIEFAKSCHKNYTQRKTWEWPWAREASNHLGLSPFNISATAALAF